MFIAAVVMLLSGSASAQCYRWVPTGDHDLTTTLLPVAAPERPRAFLVRLRGVKLPRYEGACERETLFAQMAKAKILLETAQALDLLFCLPEQDGEIVVATILVDGRDLADTLVKRGFAESNDGRGWCGNAGIKQ